jgi:hypothetical protein
MTLSREYLSSNILSDDEYDEFLLSTPLEERFDLGTLELLIVEGVPKHEAHDMMLEEYISSRTKFIRYDDAEKKRLSFYLPLFPAMRSSDFAHSFNISLTKFLVAAIELGLIRFMYEYHDQYDSAIAIKQDMGNRISDKQGKILYTQINKQKITLGSAVGVKGGACTHFTPNVYDWFYDALASTSLALNMTMSDLCYCCWCISMQNCMPNGSIDNMIAQDVSDILEHFNIEIDIYGKRIEQLLSHIKDDGALLHQYTNTLLH